MTYANGEVPICDTITTVVEEGIDADTITRMNEVLDLKGLKAAQSDSVPAGSGETSLLVGIRGSKGAVDAHVDKLAKAGNESKCRFVFALHPFMSNPITPANYDESVKVLKQKFTQVMDHGVRQIAILADDAGDQGKDLYIRLCREMTDWLHEQQKAENADGALKYPGLKDTLIFCPVNYMWVTVRAGTAGCPRPSRSSTPAAACGARSTTASPRRSRGAPASPPGSRSTPFTHQMCALTD